MIDIEKNNRGNGIFITFEGIDGCGKTTQARYLSDYLRGKNIKFIMTREPGGTRVAEKIREILLNRDNIEITGRTELLLYLASRAQHTDEVIIPALKSGVWVISDRYSDSSVAYQGAGRGLGVESVRNMTLFATDGMEPDLTFFIDISPETAYLRMKKQGKVFDRLESETENFMNEVRKGYYWIMENCRNRFFRIDGEKSPEKVWEDIKSILMEKIPELK